MRSPFLPAAAACQSAVCDRLIRSATQASPCRQDALACNPATRTRARRCSSRRSADGQQTVKLLLFLAQIYQQQQQFEPEEAALLGPDLLLQPACTSAQSLLEALGGSVSGSLQQQTSIQLPVSLRQHLVSHTHARTQLLSQPQRAEKHPAGVGGRPGLGQGQVRVGPQRCCRCPAQRTYARAGSGPKDPEDHCYQPGFRQGWVRTSISPGHTRSSRIRAPRPAWVTPRPRG